MRTQSRRVPLLAACAFALAASLSAHAGDVKPATTAATLPPTAAAIGGTPTSPEGQRLAAELAELETTLVKHLKGQGEPGATFDALNTRRQALATRLAATNLPAADRRILDERLGRTTSVITRSLRLTGGGSTLSPEVRKAVIAAGNAPALQAAADPLYAVDTMLGELDKAAADPAQAQTIFDNLTKRYGGPSGGAAAVDFRAVRESVAKTWSFTPKGAPGTNSAKARELDRPMPGPALPGQAPVAAVAAVQVDYAGVRFAAARALDEFRQRLPGAPQDFAAERGANLLQLWESGRAAVTAMRGDPNTFKSIDELVAHLIKIEAESARSIGITAPFPSSDEDITERLDKIGRFNPELAEFSAILWTYRAFVRESVRKAPLGTRFAAWETYPQGAGARGGEVVAFKHEGTDFVGLRFEKNDKSSEYAGTNEDGSAIVRILTNADGTKEITRQNFDGQRVILLQVIEKTNAAGQRVERQTFDPATNISEMTTYAPGGKVLRYERGNSKTGDAIIRQLGGPGEHFEATLTKGRREVKFLDGGAAPYRLQVDHVNADGSLEMDFRVMNDGRVLKKVSAHVKKVTKDDKIESWDADVSGLPPASSPDRRKAAALALAREILGAIGEADPDGRKAAAFADFLNFNAIMDGLGEYVGPNGTEPAIRLSIAPGDRKVFTLILQKPNGERTVLTGFFGERTAEPGRPRGVAMLVQTPTKFDADWNMENAHDPSSQLRAARVAYEYIGAGQRVFREDTYKTTHNAYGGGNWNPGNWFASKESVTHRGYQVQTFDASLAESWDQTRKWTVDDPPVEIPGSSPALKLAGKIASFPGVKQVLDGSNYVSNFVYTGIVNLAESNISGDLARLNSVATRSRNPAWAYKIAGSQPDGEKEPEKFELWAKKILAELTPGARAILDKRALELRPEHLAAMGVTEETMPLYYEQAMKLPPNDLEAYFTLPEFGAGSYGKQLSRNGHSVLGFFAAAGEAVGQMVTNPLTWAMPYAFSALGKFATNLGTKGLALTEAGSTGMGRAVSLAGKAVSVGRGLIISSVVIPFGLTTGAHVNDAIQKFGTPEGTDALANAVVDLTFLVTMARSMGKDMPGYKFGKSLIDRFRAPKVEAPIVKGPAGEGGPVVEAKAPVQLEFDFMKDPALAKPPVNPGTSGTSAVVEAPVVGEGVGNAGAGGAKPVVEAVAKPPLLRRMGKAIGQGWKEFLNDAQGRGIETKPLEAGQVKAPTKVEANGPVAESAAANLPTGAKPLEIKSGSAPKVVEAKAVETKAVETKVVETKAVETKAVETKAVETKAVETKVVETKATETKVGEAEVKSAKSPRGEQLEFEFMKGKEPKLAKLREEPVRGKSELDVKAEERVNGKAEVAPKVKESLWRKAFRRVGEGAYGSLTANNLAPKPPIVVPQRQKLPWSTKPEMPEDAVNPPAPAEDVPGDSQPEPEPESQPQPDLDHTLQPRDENQNNGKNNYNSGNTASSTPGGAGGGGGGGEGGGGKGPKAPSFGGFGDGGGGGGNGADGGGGGGGDGAASGGGGGGSPSGPAVSPAVPEGLTGGGPSIPVKRGPRAAPNESSVGGGHDPLPSLASRFDGSRDRKNQGSGWTPVPMKGLGAGDSPGLPRLAARTAPLTAPASADVPAPVERGAGGAVAPARMVASGGVKPEEEDFNYTYMPPARHKYELPEDRPSDGKDWRDLLALLLRGAAAASVGYLVYHSDLPYLVGMTRRRRRDGTNDA